ncbi:putative membrane protein [Sphingomonas vulcanisoli]|uniref:Membrane protein n=1 Tax=Sphingomonas vulcanisoli TaxID=1658060 RepID=A0ABX0TUD4_9SPHN|nr:bestrophin family protein [Sphingomonas vulcanisoli]NIJ08643.1 putative membrane protein [Sphingomonas vulcanisoli]
MIIERRPRLRQIVSDVWLTLLLLFFWDVAVTVFYFALPFKAPALPLTLFGTALALVLGVRDNSAYQRWWEGRILWGAMINASRSLARQTLAFLDGDDSNRIDLSRTLVLRQIAYVHALRCSLRRQPADAEVLRFLSAHEADEGLSRTNIANGLLDGSARRIAAAEREGLIDSIQQVRLESTLVDITNAQGGMERLKNTPLPNGYRFFPELFTRLFCLLLPIGLVETLGSATPAGSTIAGLMFLTILRIADDLVDPFANGPHDVPLSAMCRTIEIDLLQALGDPAPEPLQPVRGVLW